MLQDQKIFEVFNRSGRLYRFCVGSEGLSGILEVGKPFEPSAGTVFYNVRRSYRSSIRGRMLLGCQKAFKVFYKVRRSFRSFMGPEGLSGLSTEFRSFIPPEGLSAFLQGQKDV